MGSRPTHPELLDYLASYFVDNGWSMKKVHRLILLSNAYQEASDYDAKIAEADPDNKLLWRYPRHRMEAEAIRDSMLATSGLLNPQMGGPGVFPPVPPGLISELSATAVAGGWRTEKDPAQSDRRSVYIFVRRNLPYPLLQEFDTANTFESCDYRKNTVTPPQSLDLLNNELVLDWARSLAGRVFNDSGLTPAAQVDRAFRFDVRTRGERRRAEDGRRVSREADAGHGGSPREQRCQAAVADQSAAGNRSGARGGFCRPVPYAARFQRIPVYQLRFHL